jgi:hypothetical protein
MLNTTASNCYKSDKWDGTYDPAIGAMFGETVPAGAAFEPDFLGFIGHDLLSDRLSTMTIQALFVTDDTRGLVGQHRLKLGVTSMEEMEHAMACIDWLTQDLATLRGTRVRAWVDLITRADGRVGNHVFDADPVEDGRDMDAYCLGQLMRRGKSLTDPDVLRTALEDLG